jgi:HEAT repeat protein
MIGGEVAAAAACAVTAVLIASVLGLRARSRRARAAGAESEVRPLLFEALDRGEFDPTVLAALTPVQRRALQAQARSLLPKLRGQDRETLGRLLDLDGSVDAARRQSRSKRARTRAEAGEFLGESGSPAAVRDLVALLADPDPRVRWSAARALGRLGHPGAISPLLGALEGPRALPVDVVADAVFQIRDCPMSVLRQGLRSRSAPTRAVAVELLGRFQGLSALDDVVAVLHGDPSVEVRARAARALGRMGSPRAVDALLASLEEGPVAMRVQAVWALGEIGAPQAVPALRALLVGPSRQMAEPAAVALAALGDPGLRVLKHVSEGDGHSAAAASHALFSLDGHPGPMDLRSVRHGGWPRRVPAGAPAPPARN